ncbi:MAG TPA: M20/M25/M40 family metallo-hydrolase [Bryobacteraceae bacterium]|nr:M20/M25/M40 family metallo-hydrolase [Bryobacteraceae bacterium]
MAANPVPTIAAVGELADRPAIREALQWFTREKQWVNDIHLQLCRIPAQTFLEQQRAEWLAGQFRAIGWHAGIDRAGNVLASLDAEPQGSLVALTAHLDTVLAPRMKEDISIDDDGDMRGPGVSDNGAGLSALLAIAKALKSATDSADIWSRLLLIANVGEEGEGDLRGIRHICRQPELLRRIRAFIVLDGAATDHITTHALGSRRFEITFTGPGGHSWSDFGIGNPVHALSRAIALFVDQRPLDPRSTPKVSINVGIIEGGASINAIPAGARAKVDIRSESDEKIEHLVAALHTAVGRAEEIENLRAAGGKVTARIREIGSRPAARISNNAPIVARLKSVDAHLGIRSRLDCASTDANIPLSMGVPAVCIGAGGQGGGAHTTGEWYRPAGRDLGLKRILLAAALLLEDTAAE